MSSSDPTPESASSKAAPEQVDGPAQASSQAATMTGDNNGDAAASSAKTDAHHAAAAAAAPTETPASSSTDDLADAATLRSRIADLTNQVTGLNGKLVSSFMRISDLEDDLSDARERVMSGSTKVAELEKERQEHLAALNTGLLVEKAHVSTEMTRMMDRVIEETKQRGAAESEKAKIEAELDELSASLFNEANRMVAVEKLARHRAEEKSKSMEERLQDTEGIMLEQQKVVADLQKRLDEAQQAQQQAKKGGDGAAEAAAATAQHQLLAAASHQHSSSPPPLVLMLDIVPYQELHAFLNHLRKLRKQLAPFYTYPYDPARPYLSHRKTSSGNYPTSNSANASSSSSSSLASSSSSSSSATAHNFTPASSADATQTSPFLLAGVSRHKDYPLLPSNCESLVSLSSQLSLPFIKRCQEEDSDPCLRLDFAPGLNWLSRRQANTAILDGLLVIEPVFPGGKVEDEEGVRRQYRHLPPAACAMCGMHVVNVPMPGGGGHSTGAGGETTTTMASWAQSAASSLRDVAGGSTGGSSSLSPSVDSTSGAEHASSPASAGASPKPPTLKTARSGLFSSLSSLRAKAGSPKLPLWADGSAEHTAASAGDATASNSAATTPGVTSSSAVDPLASAALDDSSHQGSTHPLPVPTHIFRLSETANSRYLLCPHHCLARLRAACAFWGYLRSLERQVVLEGKLAWGEEGEKKGVGMEGRRGSAQGLGGGVNGVIKEEEVGQANAVETPLSPAGRDKALPPVEDVASTDSAAAAPTSTDIPAPTTSTTGDEATPASQDGETSNETDVQTKRSSNGAGSSDDDEDTDGGFHDAQSQDGHHNGGGGTSEAAKKEDEAPSSPLDEAKAEPNPSKEDDTGEEDDDEANNSGATETSTSTKVAPPAALDIPKANEGQHHLGDAEDGGATPTVSSAAAAAAGATPMSPSTSMGPPPVPPRRSAAAPSSAGGGPPALPARRERNTTAPAPASAPPPPPPRASRAKRTLHEIAGEEDAGEEEGVKLAGPPTTWEEKVWLEVTKLKRDMWQARVGFEDRALPAASGEVKMAKAEAEPTTTTEAETVAAAGPEVVITDAKVESENESGGGGRGDDLADGAK